MQGELTAKDRLTIAMQEDNRRVTNWSPSALPEPYRPDKHAVRIDRSSANKRGARLTDVYIAMLSITVVGAFAAGVAGFLTDNVVNVEESITRSGFALISAESLLAAFGLVVLSWVGRFATVLGPVSVDRAQAAWWLSLPSNITPFLRRILTIRMSTAAFLGSVIWLFLSWGVRQVSNEPSATNLGSALVAALSCGLLVLLVMAITALAQTLGYRLKLRQLWSRIPGLVTVLLAVEAIFYAIATPTVRPTWLWFVSPVGLLFRVEQGGFASLAVPVILVVLAGLTIWVTLIRIGEIKHADLRDAGYSNEQVSGVMTLVESRNLTSTVLGKTATSTRTLMTLEGIRRPVHPVIAWFRADLVVLLRAGIALRPLLSGLITVLLVLLSEAGQSVILLAIAVGLSGLFAMRGLTAATDEIADHPALQRLLPLRQSTSWMAHTLAPAVFLFLWGIVVGGVLGWAIHGPANVSGWWYIVITAALSSLALSGSTVRTSTRPPLDWMLVIQGTQAHQIIAPIAKALIRGVDTGLLALLPLIVVIALAQLTPWYLLFAFGTTFGAWCVAAYVRS